MAPSTSPTWSSFYHEHCVYLPPMAGWFFFSALLSSYNKYVFGRDHYHFSCPLFLTSLHFGFQWLASFLLCKSFPHWTGAERISRFTNTEWAWISLPCGLVTSGDVGLSNLSLVTISLTFYTMVKASTPIFVLFWAYAFGIERITVPLIMIVIIIGLGEFLTVVGETEFELYGLLLCLFASILSGARWTLVQLKIQTIDPPLNSPIATMRILAPSMFSSMLFLSIILEHPVKMMKSYTRDDLIMVAILGLVGAILAMCMILCEFHLIMYSSAIILMIGGVCKEMISILIGVLVFHDNLNRLNVSGCFVVFCGVVFYKLTFHAGKQHGGVVEPDASDLDEHSLLGRQDDLVLDEQEATGTLYKQAWEAKGNGGSVELRKNANGGGKSYSHLMEEDDLSRETL